MQIRVGYRVHLRGYFPQPTPMILMVSIHYSRASDIVIPDLLTTDPPVTIAGYRDGFGNWCSRIVAPPGRIRLKGAGQVRDTGAPDAAVLSAQQHAVQDLPDDILVFLLGSRYCETDLLTEVAWQLFSSNRSADGRVVQAICDYVHNRIGFRLSKRPDPPGLRGRPTTSGEESAETTHTWRSHSAGV